jgi:hypothetical protein
VCLELLNLRVLDSNYFCVVLLKTKPDVPRKVLDSCQGHPENLDAISGEF